MKAKAKKEVAQDFIESWAKKRSRPGFHKILGDQDPGRKKGYTACIQCALSMNIFRH